MNRLTVEDTACKGHCYLLVLSPPGARVMNRLTVEDTACKGQYLLLTQSSPGARVMNRLTVVQPVTYSHCPLRERG